MRTSNALVSGAKVRVWMQLKNTSRKTMKQLKQLLALAGVAAALGLSTSNVAAQGRPQRGNFDPEQFRAQMMDRYKERLEVKSDEEWKLISERIEKVTTAQRELR